MIRPKFAGADVSAEWFDVCVLVKAQQHEHRFPQSKEGYEGLGEWLKDIGIAKIWISLEYTGGYEQKLALWLLAKGHKVSLVDPSAVHSFKPSLGRRAKTDRLDAYVLARFTKERRPALFAPRPNAYDELLQLVRHRQTIVEALTQWRNRRAAPKTSAFVHAQQQTFIEVLRLQLEALEDSIRKLIASDTQMAKNVELISSIKGLQFITAVSFLAEAGPIQGYPTPESLALAAGLVPIAFKSGKSINKLNRSPYGNERLRQSLALSSSIARRHNPAMAFFAARIESKGGKSPALLNKAVRRKLCHVIWGILTKQEAFDPAKAIRGFPKPS